ncbi:MAG: PA14 domain-containing protein [Dongiaceae bacterium]
MAMYGRGMIAGLVAALLTGAPAAHSGSFSDIKPVDPQPAAEATQPGLAVLYVFEKVRHVDAIENASGGSPGAPLPKLDYESGAGKVLTSNLSDRVGAKISGFINFPEPGRWLMATQSNDGVRVKLAGQVIIEDPDVHADQFSENAELNITEAGWYELAVTYFERENTSTLQLYWQRPGASEFEIVPAEAFAHTK